MFSEAISSISCRWRPSSPLIAAAISGSASASVAVKNELGAEAVLELGDEEVIGRNISTVASPYGQGGRLCVAVERSLRDTTSAGIGQAFAVSGSHLCKIWWGGSPSLVAPALSRGPYPRKVIGRRRRRRGC